MILAQVNHHLGCFSDAIEDVCEYTAKLSVFRHVCGIYQRGYSRQDYQVGHSSQTASSPSALDSDSLEALL